MTLEEHASNLGKLITNLQGLELALRQFLCRLNNEAISVPSVGEKTVLEDHLTNYYPLGTLIKKYNEVVRAEYPHFIVDNSVVELRDALAHGRLVSTSNPPQPPQRIFKFSRPKNGTVDLVFDEIMDDAWFKKWLGITHDQIDKVWECLQEFSIWQTLHTT